MRHIYLIALVLLVASTGCSDAQLYHGSNVSFQNDRLALAGTFCSVDPTEQNFPVKVLFLIDQSSTVVGLDSTYDYASAVDAVVQRYLTTRGGTYSFGIIGYGGQAQLLSGGPDNEAFTRQTAYLENAVQLLRLPSPCNANGACRDMQGALSLGASLIRGDLAAVPPGQLARTRYIIVHFAAGPPSPRLTKCACDNLALDPMCMNPPMITDDACEQEVYSDQLAALVQAVRSAGAVDLRYDTFYLRDPAVAQLQNNSDAIGLLQRLSAAGAGAFECITANTVPSCAALFPAPRNAMAAAQYQQCVTQETQCSGGEVSYLDFDLSSNQKPFLVKKVIVANLNTLARQDGPHLDSDADGLSDDEEATLGTSPVNADTDGDGITDLVEVRLGMNPLVADPQPGACAMVQWPADLTQEPMPDTDGDLLNDCEERLLGTDPTLPDSDGDGLPDGLELRGGSNYLLADYLLPPYDHDGIANGDEVVQHTQPTADDSRDALGRAYFYSTQDNGVSAMPYTTQPTQVTGVTILDVSQGSTTGGGTLRFSAAPLGCDALFPAPRAAAQAAAYARCGTCAGCSALSWKDAGDCDFGPAQLLDPSAIQQSGGVSLTLDSISVNGSCTPGGAAGGRDFSIVVRVENANILPAMDVSETIIIGTAQRDCVKYQVTNVSLMTPLVNQTVGFQESGSGMNNVYIYMAQGPEGQLAAPGIYSTSLVRVRYNPPAIRDPNDAEIVLQQQDFVVLGGN